MQLFIFINEQIYEILSKFSVINYYYIIFKSFIFVLLSNILIKSIEI
jgi:hypothetical protein